MRYHPSGSRNRTSRDVGTHANRLVATHAVNVYARLCRWYGVRRMQSVCSDNYENIIFEDHLVV